MKRVLTILSLFFPICISAQFHDDFLDNGTELDPAWQGTCDKFYIKNVDATANRLVLNDTAAASGKNFAFLSRPSSALIDGEWEATFHFDVELTANNYARYLVATDSADLTAAQNGYFVWIGNTSKEVSLYRQDGEKTTKIIDGADGRTASAHTISIRLTRSSDGTWQLQSRIDDETDFAAEGTVRDRIHLHTQWAGIVFCYSKSNGREKFECSAISAAGNAYVKPTQSLRKNDIVFSEIMADPEPQTQLPPHEFLEIYNRTDSTIDLSDWTLMVNTKSAKIGETTLPPHAYATICAESAAELFAPYGLTAPATPWPTITNSGALLQLFDDHGNLIAWTDFSDAWYGGDGFKKDGGWSLERINCDYLDNHAENWTPSEHYNGGTPSQPNSMAQNLRDERTPRLEFIAATADTITLHFSKSMDETALSDLRNYSLALGIDTIMIAQPQAKIVQLKLRNKLAINQLQTLNIENLFCVDSLPLGTVEREIALPERPEIGDVVLNEILFNPIDDGVDFVELWNISDKTIDLSQMLLTRRIDGDFESRTTICSEPRLFAPHSFLVLTADPEMVCQQYDCPANADFATVKLPSLNDDEGNIVVIRNDGTVMDEFAYTEKMHHAFVTNAEGVSLERVDPTAPTQQHDNWQSASFEAGYATPARQNSQYIAPTDGKSDEEKTFWLEYETFTPNNDGYRDLLPLRYRLPSDGFTAAITIYNPTGTRMRRLLSGELTGTEGTIYWNGRNDSEALCTPGIYVIFVEAIRPDGQKIQQKIVCVLSM